MEGDGGSESHGVSQQDTESCFVSLHPLSIDHILENVLNHLIGDLTSHHSCTEASNILTNFMNLRLVCKQWQEATTRVFSQAQVPASFGQMRFGRNYNHQLDLEMQKFLNVMKGSAMVPVQRFRIKETFFVKENQKLMQDFLRICGPDAVELSFFFDNTITIDFTRRSFPDLNLSKLKSLTFHGETYQGKSFFSKVQGIAIFIELLLTAATNLQNLQIDILENNEEWQPALKRLGKTIGRLIPKTVKSLGLLDIPFSDTELDKLGETEFKLEKLFINFTFLESGEPIRKLLSKQAASLKNLQLCNCSSNSLHSVQLPRLYELLHLKINGSTSPFSCADLFPKLAVLDAEEFKCETSWLQMLSSSKNVVSVKKISLPYELPEGPFVQKISHSFPNIQKLKIQFAENLQETLPDVFAYCPSIKELWISRCNEVNFDCLLSGFSEEDWSRIIARNDFENVNLEEIQQGPSLLNMTKLEKLVIDQFSADGILTDFLAHFVFMKMTSLSELYPSSTNLSTAYERLLKDRMILGWFYEDGSDDE